MCGEKLTAELRKLPSVAADPGPQPVVQPTPELELARVKAACSFSLRVLISGVGVDWDDMASPTPCEDVDMEGDAKQDGEGKGGAGRGGAGKNGEGNGGAGNGGEGKDGEGKGGAGQGGEEKDGAGQGEAGLCVGQSGALGSTVIVAATAEDVLRLRQGHARVILDERPYGAIRLRRKGWGPRLVFACKTCGHVGARVRYGTLDDLPTRAGFMLCLRPGSKGHVGAGLHKWLCVAIRLSWSRGQKVRVCMEGLRPLRC